MLAEIDVLVEAYRLAGLNALEAGFDGVEVHASRGLIEQFLRRASNCRQDPYGGSIANRARFLMRVVEALARACGNDRVGVRLSLSTGDEDQEGGVDLLEYLVEHLAAVQLSYLHVVRGSDKEAYAAASEEKIRSLWPGFLIWAGNFSTTSAEAAINNGTADAVAFGRRFASNPDLPFRLQIGGPLNSYDSHTFYGGGKLGYTDYPTLNSFLLPE
ncbi:hypothetical protein N185_15580 [Sinorhizobium sp. GW3]|nr:hypothetical protein N185_15580 [Sinorhizobium sp. GW3]